ncbi:hypothetical protein DPMN_084503, partial [Dreissena polymorpha]
IHQNGKVSRERVPSCRTEVKVMGRDSRVFPTGPSPVSECFETEAEITLELITMEELSAPSFVPCLDVVVEQIGDSDIV